MPWHGRGPAKAFFHSAGEHSGHFFGVLAESDEFELDLHDDGDGIFGEVGMLAQGESDIIEDGHGIEERVALEKDADFFAVISLSRRRTWF